MNVSMKELYKELDYLAVWLQELALSQDNLTPGAHKEHIVVLYDLIRFHKRLKEVIEQFKGASQYDRS